MNNFDVQKMLPTCLRCLPNMACQNFMTCQHVDGLFWVWSKFFHISVQWNSFGLWEVELPGSIASVLFQWPHSHCDIVPATLWWQHGDYIFVMTVFCTLQWFCYDGSIMISLRLKEQQNKYNVWNKNKINLMIQRIKWCYNTTKLIRFTLLIVHLIFKVH